MLLRDEGPTSSMQEDLAVLKLEHLFEHGDAPMAAAAPAKKGKDAAPSGDAAAPRTEVPVRAEDDAEGDGSGDFGATKATPPKDDAAGAEGGEKPAKPNPFAKKDDDDDEGGEEGGDEKPAKPNPFAKKDDKGDEDEMGEAIESILSMTEEDIDGLTEEEAAGVIYVLAALEDITENPSPKLEAAFAVLDSFYGQLAEGETSTIDRDALLGVVEAFEYVATDLGILSEMHGGMGKHIARHSARASAHGMMAHPGSMTHQGKVKEIKVKMKKAHAFKKGLKDFKPPAMKHGKHGKGYGKHEDEEQTSTPLSDLVTNLNALKNAVTAGKVEQESQSELLDGFKSVHETATTWYEAIANEVKTAISENKTDENDPRIVIGRHLEGIANDAASVGSLVAEGKVTAEQAENDLRNLAADLDDTVEVMRSVE